MKEFEIEYIWKYDGRIGTSSCTIHSLEFTAESIGYLGYTKVDVNHRDAEETSCYIRYDYNGAKVWVDSHDADVSHLTKLSLRPSYTFEYLYRLYA